MSSDIEADLHPSGKYIQLWFPYDRAMIKRAQGIPSSEFRDGKKKGDEEFGRHFRFKADKDIARLIREAFPDMELSDRLKQWGHEQNREHLRLRTLAQADDAELQVMPNVLPELTALIDGEDVEDLTGKLWNNPTPQGRPYQRADIAFMKEASNPLNANQPGTGKTFEAIGSVFEEELDEGSHLVICPKISVWNVWVPALEAWNPWPVLGAPQGREDREAVVREALAMAQGGEPFWLVVPWYMVTLKRQRAADGSYVLDDKGNVVLIPEFPEIFDVGWTTCIADEFHKAGLTNVNSNTREGLDRLTTLKRIPMSGTPIGGDPMKLWAVLNWANPSEFSNKWRFAEQWVEIEEVEYQTRQGVKKHKKTHGVRADREAAFWEMLSRYMVRRTKEEVLPWLPPKDYPPTIWVEMSPKQKKQYLQFAEEAETILESGERVTAVSVLSEYARLKQFANAYCTTKGIDKNGRPIVFPTEDSPKLEALMQILDERGISKGELEGDQQVVVFSQFSRMVDMVYDHLVKEKIPTAKITGGVSDNKRTEIRKSFQSGEGARVLVMTTTAGGVSIDLDAADTVVILDETWVPDDQEQAEDRVHRGSRLHQVTVYYVKTKDTIEEYIEEVVTDKAEVNRKILDVHRMAAKKHVR